MKSGWRRERRRLWQECARLVAELEIDRPFDSAEFVDRLARRRGRRIELVPIHARSATPSGILLSTDQADYLCYAVNTPPLHREHILLHEAGHPGLRPHRTIHNGLGTDHAAAPPVRRTGAPNWCAAYCAAPTSTTPRNARPNCSRH